MSDFKRPFLAIYFGNGIWWHIDVGGEIDSYLQDYTSLESKFLGLTDAEKLSMGIPHMWDCVFGDASNWESQATPLLKEILSRLKKLRAIPQRIYGTESAEDPSHVLMNGKFFRVLDDTDFAEISDPKHNENLDVAQYLSALR